MFVRCRFVRFRRPASTTRPTLDVQEAGRAMHVTDVVTGHFLKEGSQLQITLEAIDVENNRTEWRDTMTVAAPDMIAMRGQITAKVRQGLVPALGAGTDSAEGATRPKNEEAYDLYLRSIAVPHDPAPNKDAIVMLERAVGLDPSYAPAWNALGRRYHYDSAYSNGGQAAFQRANAAFERALALDPNFIEPAGELTGARWNEVNSSGPIRMRRRWWIAIRRRRALILPCRMSFAMAGQSRNLHANAIPRWHWTRGIMHFARACSRSNNWATTRGRRNFSTWIRDQPGRRAI